MDGCLEHIKKHTTKVAGMGAKLPRNTMTYDKQRWFLRAVDKVNLWNLIFIVISHWTGQEMNMNLFLLPL